MNIALIHMWTKEIRDVPIETIEKKSITVRWGIQGVYELDIIHNTLRARSVSARRKNPICLWQAQDIEMVRRLWFNHHNPIIVVSEREKAYQRHMATMPK